MLMKSLGSINQLIFFLLAGFFAVSIDYLIYTSTTEKFGLIFSKLLGFYSGLVVSFLVNSSLTFKKFGKRFLRIKYFLRYFIVLSINMLINVIINLLLISFFSSIPNITFLAFSIATLFSMVFNFIGMKLLVFD